MLLGKGKCFKLDVWRRERYKRRGEVKSHAGEFI